MGWGSDYGGWAPYVSVGQRIQNGVRAAKALAKEEKRTPCPVVVTTRDIAKTFWGRSWCDNLERYSDFSNRLPRGRTYLRNGSVADLVIEPGLIRAIVGGSEAYQIKIKITPLNSRTWNDIERDCAQEINSLLDLMQGKFSNAIMQRLTRANDGLFPSKSEISMSCTCPDMSVVCKHIAATIYGVGARLDREPELLFKLRQVNHLALIGKAMNQANLDQALGSGTATLEGDDLGSIFGIDLESGTPPAKSSAKKTAKTAKSSKSTNAATATPAASVKAASVKAASVKAASVKAASVKAASVKAASVKAASVKAAGVKAASAKAASVKAASVEAAAAPAITASLLDAKAVSTGQREAPLPSKMDKIKALIARTAALQKAKEMAKAASAKKGTKADHPLAESSPSATSVSTHPVSPNSESPKPESPRQESPKPASSKTRRVSEPAPAKRAAPRKSR